MDADLNACLKAPSRSSPSTALRPLSARAHPSGPPPPSTAAQQELRPPGGTLWQKGRNARGRLGGISVTAGCGLRADAFAGPAYIFRWGQTNAYHGQAFMYGPEDEGWYDRVQAPTRLLVPHTFSAGAKRTRTTVRRSCTDRRMKGGTTGCGLKFQTRAPGCARRSRWDNRRNRKTRIAGMASE